MSLNPAFIINAVTNTALMNLFNGAIIFADYDFDNSEVTVSSVSSPTTVNYPIFSKNVELVEKWIILIKDNLDISWETTESFDTNIQTNSSGLTASFKISQFLSNLQYNHEVEQFTILPSPAQTVTFGIFDRWAKFLRRVNDDARIFA